jgi:hypothetical protein
MILAGAVIVAGMALAASALLPWVGVTAEIGLLNADLTRAIRGVDDATGWFVLCSGLVAMLLGILGLARSWLFTGLAILPGAVAALALAMFLTNPQHLANELSFHIPGIVDVHPTIQYGWFLGLVSSITMALLSATALVRRR